MLALAKTAASDAVEFYRFRTEEKMKDGGSAFPVYGERRFGECGEFSGGDEDVTDFGAKGVRDI